jgi:hypothetical protein
MHVFVVDTVRRRRAGKAAVWRRAPFTIVLQQPAPAAVPAVLRLTIGPRQPDDRPGAGPR